MPSTTAMTPAMSKMGRKIGFKGIRAKNYKKLSLLSTKKQGTFIKNKNCSKLDQKLSKIGFANANNVPQRIVLIIV